MTIYETHAQKEIHAWKNPQIGWFGEAMKFINFPLDKVGDFALSTPGVGYVISKSVQGAISFCGDAAHWSVRPKAIYKEFEKAGHNICKSEDIFHLKLEEIDRVAAWLNLKYKGIALAEGATAGTVGLIGIPVDVVALITLNLRAIGEYATYYGFDISSREERLFAMNVLGLASSPSDASKALAMSQLVRIANDVAMGRTWKELNKHTVVPIIEKIAKAVGIRITKGKLAEILPIAGAIIGGCFNAYYTAKVCDAAYYLYRERFLAKKHGPQIIEITVPPAENLDPAYPEESEPLLIEDAEKEGACLFPLS